MMRKAPEHRLACWFACVLLGWGLLGQPLWAATGNLADDPDQVVEKVVVYNWSDYIPEGVLEDFTKETGIQVEYSTFDNNEVMYTRLKLLKGRGYDVLVPSTAMVGRLRVEGLIQPINRSLLEHFGELSPELLNKRYDPDNAYSVPYLWGSTGIGVNTAKVDVSKLTRWSHLWQPRWRGRLLLSDDMREVFHMALRINGHSTNTTNPDEIKLAYERLKRLMPNVKLISADPRPALMSGEVDLGVIWNGEMAVAQQENPDFSYIYPHEGASFWIDSFVIPSRASHVENAHKFIDFMLRADIAARCVRELGYAASNAKAKALLDEKTRNNTIIFPAADMLVKAEFQMEVGAARDLYLLYWDKLKAGK